MEGSVKIRLHLRSWERGTGLVCVLETSCFSPSLEVRSLVFCSPCGPGCWKRLQSLLIVCATQVCITKTGAGGWAQVHLISVAQGTLRTKEWLVFQALEMGCPSAKSEQRLRAHCSQRPGLLSAHACALPYGQVSLDHVRVIVCVPFVDVGRQEKLLLSPLPVSPTLPAVRIS